MDADGSNIHRLTEGEDDWGATWSPDGKLIAYKSWLGPSSPDPQIWVRSPDGPEPSRELTSGPGARFAPSWSPDGSRIVFNRELANRQSMWSVAIDGTDLRSVMDEPQAHGELTSGGGAWAKGGRIVFTHSIDPPATASPLIREDLAIAALLLTALILALVAVLVVQINPPFGAYAAMIGISTLASAVISQEWRFVPAAIVGGLTVDLVVRFASVRLKAIAAGAGSAAALVVGAVATVAFTSGVAWSPTLIAGVTVASVFLGSLLAELVVPARPTRSAT
jgi:hypothetical protein